jgi:DNA polymerase-3 subunit delta
LTYKEIIKSLRAKDYKPVYFLHGPESYYIDSIANYIEQKVLSEAEKSFNQTILYGKDTEAKTLIDTASRYPMMASHQVVILREAQEMKGLQDLQLYIEKAVPTTILVICHKHKKLDARTKFAKSLKKHAILFESKKLYDNQVPDWIFDYLKGKKLTINPNASQLIAEYLGTDLSKIANELDKLAINLPEGTQINEKHIQDNIGISKDYNVFELQKALGQRNVLKANRIVKYFIANPRKNPLVMVTGTLYNYFSKIYMLHFLRNLPDRELSSALKLRSEFFLREYKSTARNYNLAKTQNVISVLKEYDLKSKGVDSDNVPEGELMKEMVYKILH